MQRPGFLGPARRAVKSRQGPALSGEPARAETRRAAFSRIGVAIALADAARDPRMTQAFALILSIAIEASVAALVARRAKWRAPALAALAATLGTLATHGLVWRGVEDGADIIGYWPALALAEASAVVVESLFYRLLAAPNMQQALMVSAVANIASSGFGLLLDALDVF